jgi:uncharacterized protein (TIGR03435 family)
MAVVLTCANLHAQTTPAEPQFEASVKPTFEVASVKPSTTPYAVFRLHPGGRLEITCMTLNVIMRQAYAVRYYQIVGGPNWLDADHFDIIATAGTDANRGQMMAMLQTLLADRFQLKVHRESREGNIYALVVGKGGPKLKPPTSELSHISLYRITPPDKPGINYALDGKKSTMTQFAEHLTDEVSRPVLDRTGIQGEFDFRVDYSISDDPETGPPIFVALQEQLGLKLEATKGRIETLVVDHADKPSRN